MWRIFTKTGKDGLTAIIPIIAVFSLFSYWGCTSKNNEKNEISQQKINEIGEEEFLFVLPKDRQYIHYKASEYNNSAAFWIRENDSILLQFTNSPSISYPGYFENQYMNGAYVAFHLTQPRGKMNLLTTDANDNSWLLWGPGLNKEGNFDDDVIAFDPLGIDCYYCVYKKNDLLWMRNNKIQENYHGPYPPIFSKNSKTTVWIDEYKDSSRVVVNGITGKKYKSIYHSSLFVSQDGSHIFFIASSNDGKEIAVWDGKEIGKYKNISGTAKFSEDGNHYAFFATKNGDNQILIHDGKDGQEVNNPSALTLSSDGKHVAFITEVNDIPVFCIDGKPQDIKFDELSTEFVFSPNGEQYMYVGKRDKEYFVVTDGKEGNACSGVFGMIFSSDGKYFAKGEFGFDLKLHIFLNGEEKWTVNGGPLSFLLFSSLGNHIQFNFSQSNRSYCFVDGTISLGVFSLSTTQFSPDGNNYAYIAIQDSLKKLEGVFSNNKMQRTFERVVSLPNYTSGNQLLYCVFDKGKYYTVVDSTVSKPYDKFYLAPSSDLKIQLDGTIQYLAQRNDSIFRVTHKNK